MSTTVTSTRSIRVGNRRPGQELVGAGTRLLEDLADLPLRLAHVLAEELGPLDVQEVPVDLLSALLREFLGQAIGHHLGDHRLAASGGTVEEHALGGPELMLLVAAGVEVRQIP